MISDSSFSRLSFSLSITEHIFHGLAPSPSLALPLHFVLSPLFESLLVLFSFVSLFSLLHPLSHTPISLSRLSTHALIHEAQDLQHLTPDWRTKMRQREKDT